MYALTVPLSIERPGIPMAFTYNVSASLSNKESFNDKFTELGEINFVRCVTILLLRSQPLTWPSITSQFILKLVMSSKI